MLQLLLDLELPVHVLGRLLLHLANIDLARRPLTVAHTLVMRRRSFRATEEALGRLLVSVRVDRQISTSDLTIGHLLVHLE